MSEEAECPQKNKLVIDQSSFWDSGNLNWDHHRVGWLISGVAAAITVLVTAISVYRHARHYHVPAQQRQIIRILYLPAVFAVISWLSYRFFRHYTYYELVQIVYEAFALGAFTLLLIEYVAESSSSGKADGALERKEKTSLPLPFCCWRYRPTKGYFLHTVKWSVMQYVVIRPLISIAGIVCEVFEVLCEESYSPKFAYVYLMATDFASISVALYGLWLFYSLCKEELEDKRPFAKFLLIKILVALTFYQVEQQFVFVLLTDRGIIAETEYWTASNISDGLNALAVTLEMVIISLCMMWAFPSSEYSTKPGQEATTSIGRALWDSINFADFFFEIWQAFRFYWNSALSRPTPPPTRRPNGRSDFDTAFRLSKFSTSGQPTGGDPWYSGSARPSMGEPMSATAPLVPPGDRYPRQPPPDPRLGNTYQQPPSHQHPRQDSRTTYPPEPQAQRRPPEGVVFGQAL